MTLNIENLHTKIENKFLLKGINLRVNPGEVHAIMGPNGAGKSVLCNTLAGNPQYTIHQGKIFFNTEDITEMSAEKRSHMGIFLSFQNPIEIPGVSNIQFLKNSLSNIRKSKGKKDLDPKRFMEKLRTNMNILEMDEKYMKRGVNEGFSGGEKKRNEMLQMMTLDPLLCILDEADSGLDIDSLKVVSKAANYMRDKKRSFIVVTHYERLLKYIEPDFVHVLANGKIVKSGGKELAVKLEERGYSWVNV